MQVLNMLPRPLALHSPNVFAHINRVPSIGIAHWLMSSFSSCAVPDTDVYELRYPCAVSEGAGEEQLYRDQMDSVLV